MRKPLKNQESIILSQIFFLRSVCRNITACSTFSNPDMITLVKRRPVPLDLNNLTSVEWDSQWEKNTEANIIKRPKDSAEQCGCQDPRIVFDHSSGFFVMAFTAYGNGGGAPNNGVCEDAECDTCLPYFARGADCADCGGRCIREDDSECLCYGQQDNTVINTPSPSTPPLPPPSSPAPLTPPLEPPPSNPPSPLPSPPPTPPPPTPPPPPERSAEIALGGVLAGVGGVVAIGIGVWAFTSGTAAAAGTQAAGAGAAAAIAAAVPWKLSRADKPIEFVPMQKRGGPVGSPRV